MLLNICWQNNGYTFLFYFYCVLIDTKDSIKNGETLSIWFGPTCCLCAVSFLFISQPPTPSRPPKHNADTKSISHPIMCCICGSNFWIGGEGRGRKKMCENSQCSFCPRRHALVIAIFDLDIAESGSLSIGVVRKRQFAFFVVNSANLTRGSNGATPVAARI